MHGNTATAWTIEQVAEHLQCSHWTIRRMISNGQLKAFRVGRLIRIRPEDLNRALKPVTTFTSAGGGRIA